MSFDVMKGLTRADFISLQEDILGSSRFFSDINVDTLCTPPVAHNPKALLRALSLLICEMVSYLEKNFFSLL